jgi:hypothetical protein
VNYDLGDSDQIYSAIVYYFARYYLNLEKKHGKTICLTSLDCFRRTRLLRLNNFGHYRCEAFPAADIWSPHHHPRILPCNQDIEHCSQDSL